MIELKPEAWKQILLEKMVVHFVGEDFPDRVAGKYFRVARTQEIPHDRAFIIAPGESHDFNLSDEDAAGLYPTNKRSLYEIFDRCQVHERLDAPLPEVPDKRVLDEP